MRPRLLKFLTGPELGLSSTIVFAGLYVWPYLTMPRPGAVFRFTLAVWIAHMCLIALSAVASRYAPDADGDGSADSSSLESGSVDSASVDSPSVESSVEAPSNDS